MAPLLSALKVEHASSENGTSTYRGDIDGTWTIGSVPQGGYALGLILEACIIHQSATRHRDPIHVSAHFLQATNVARFEVKVEILKVGKGFTNLVGILTQNGRTKITAHFIFGDLSPSNSDSAHGLKLTPPSPYARRLPLYSHPSTAMADPVRHTWKFHSLLQWAQDHMTVARNKPDSETRTHSDTVGGGGTEWGAWCELTGEDDGIKTSSLPFFGDTFHNLPVLLPENETAGYPTKSSWFPTMTMTIEFKARMPSTSDYSSRTVGLYSESRFLGEPQGRHNARVEVWTAPSRIGKGEIADGWRDKQYCIAVAEQMCLTLSMDVNRREGHKDTAKL